MKSSAFFAFLAGSTGVKADGEAHVCTGCFVTRDHTGARLFGDEDCDNDKVIEQRWIDFQSGADGYEQNVTASPYFFTCPASDTEGFTSSCETTVFVQWEANGRENFQINRGCYVHPVGIPDDDCTVWTNNERFHSCYKLCRGDEIESINDPSVPCNALPEYGLKSVEELHYQDSGATKQKCHTCSAKYGSEQEEIDACKNLNDKNASPEECPGWASRGCFEVEEITLRPDINQTKPDIGYHKGCSAFDTFNDDADEQGIICQEFQGALFEWGEACKTTCKDGDYCNEDLLEELPIKCYTCEYTWSDHGGIQGDPACAFHDLLGPIQLQNCPADKNHCVVEMTAKMIETGEQQHTIKRYCGDEAPQEETPETNCDTSISSDFSNLWAVKQCKTSCDDQIACNYHDNVFKLFETGNINRCYICADEQEGEEIGGGFCRLIQQSRCPNFADAGCYTSANWLSDWPEHENTKAQFYHGCSSFTADEIRQECHRKLVGGQLDSQAFDLTICREVCDGFSDCNFTPITPPVAPKCAACVATKDHLGNIIAGNPKCFENLEADDEDIFWAACPSTDGSPFKPVCESSSYVQWEPNGRQTLTVTQGCFEVLREENNDLDVCNFETVTGGIQVRNCIKTCDPTGRGDECNRRNMEAVIAKQGIENSDITCRSCSANSTSSPAEIEYCRNVPSPIDPTGCPSWANRACFNVRDAVIKPDGDASPGDSDIAYHKGCSSFDFKEEDNDNVETTDSVNCREYYDINAHRYTESCKETCNDNFCNEGEVKQPMKCFSCNYAWDDFGIAVGSGDPRCRNPRNFAPSDLTTCPEDKPYCFTEFEADWNQRGNQFHRVARGCTSHKSVEPPTKADNCETYLSNTNGQWSQKTCAVSCDSAVLGCNDNNDIYDLFSTSKVSRCHSCHLSERPGENIGVQDCDTNTHAGDSKTCEKYEDNGCYTAKNWHVEYGTELKEAYRGCSSFTQDEVNAPSCEDFVLGGAGGSSSSVYTTCREWCDNDRCNDQVIENPGPDLSVKCISCEAEMDFFGNITSGNHLCFEDGLGKEYEQICDTNVGGGRVPYCSNDLEVDWLPNGRQVLRIKRGCKQQTEAQSYCNEGSRGPVMFKHCQEQCAAQQGEVCNRDTIEALLSKFDSGKNMMCRECYADATMGEEWMEYCRNQPSPEDQGHQCPKWANTGCFNVRVIENGEDIAYSKGCSSFEIEGTQCTQFTAPDGESASVSRNTCDASVTPFCNKGEVDEAICGGNGGDGENNGNGGDDGNNASTFAFSGLLMLFTALLY